MLISYRYSDKMIIDGVSKKIMTNNTERYRHPIEADTTKIIVKNPRMVLDDRTPQWNR